VTEVDAGGLVTRRFARIMNPDTDGEITLDKLRGEKVAAARGATAAAVLLRYVPLGLVEKFAIVRPELNRVLIFTVGFKRSAGICW